jgi:hypothetical protein
VCSGLKAAVIRAHPTRFRAYFENSFSKIFSGFCLGLRTVSARAEDGAAAADVVLLRVRSILSHVRQRRDSLGSHHRATDGVFRPPILRVFCMHVEFWHGMKIMSMASA